MKQPIIRSIPDDVDKKSINNDLVEYKNSTFEFKLIDKGDKTLVISRVLNAVIEKATKIKSYSNNKTDKHGTATIKLQAKTDKGTLTSPFTLEGKAKCKFVDFA